MARLLRSRHGTPRKATRRNKFGENSVALVRVAAGAYHSRPISASAADGTDSADRHENAASLAVHSPLRETAKRRDSKAVMQSTAMVALRTTIMIVCLVAVPLAAVMGTALPRFLASLLDGRGKTTDAHAPAAQDRPTAVAGHEPDQATAADEAVVHLPDGEADGQHPTAHITAVRPVPDEPLTVRGEPRAPEAPVASVRGVGAAPSTEETSPFWSAGRRTSDSSPPRYSTAQYNSRGAGTNGPSTEDTGVQHVKRLKQGLHQANLLKTDYSVDSKAKQEPSERPLVKVIPQTGERDPRAVTNDPFATSEQRLRELGATYYRLESWGDRGEFYRCACDVRLGSRSRAARHFEAIEPTASQAVAAVIAQVERHSRRAGR